MEEQLKVIGERIIQQRYAMAEQVAKFQNPNYEDTSVLKEVTELQEFRAKLIQYIGEGVIHQNDRAFDNITAWGKQLGTIAVNQQLPLIKPLKATSLYRKLLFTVIKEVSIENQYSTNVSMEAISIVDELLDYTVTAFNLAYDEYNDFRYRLAQNEILRLSVPVVPIYEGIAVLPLIGEMDPDRAKYLVEHALQESVDLKLEQLFLDLSGVPMIDTSVAQHIFQVVSSLKLIGVKTTLTGIRPELAQTMVSLGINFEDIKVSVSLKRALSELNFSKR